MFVTETYKVVIIFYVSAKIFIKEATNFIWWLSFFYYIIYTYIVYYNIKKSGVILFIGKKELCLTTVE